jgi:hypothetical protein
MFSLIDFSLLLSHLLGEAVQARIDSRYHLGGFEALEGAQGID